METKTRIICPGQDFRKREQKDVVSYEECLNCGEEIEFFYDDVFRKCNSCETIVNKNSEGVLRDFGCASWCNSAEECLGSELYKKFEEFKKYGK